MHTHYQARKALATHGLMHRLRAHRVGTPRQRDLARIVELAYARVDERADLVRGA